MTSPSGTLPVRQASHPRPLLAVRVLEPPGWTQQELGAET